MRLDCLSDQRITAFVARDAGTAFHPGKVTSARFLCIKGDPVLLVFHRILPAVQAKLYS